jgi:hypothetical protein
MSRQVRVCRFCGCSDANPCVVYPLGERCCWMNDECDVCSGTECLKKWVAQKKEAARAEHRRREKAANRYLRRLCN